MSWDRNDGGPTVHDPEWKIILSFHQSLTFKKYNIFPFLAQTSWFRAIALQMRKWGKKRETRAIRSWQKFSKWGNGGKRRKRECTFSKRPTQWKRRWEKTFHKVVQHFISFTPIHQQNISHYQTFYIVYYHSTLSWPGWERIIFKK